MAEKKVSSYYDVFALNKYKINDIALYDPSKT